MRCFQLVLGSLLAATSLLGLAQAAPAPYPRYYVGVGLYASDYQPLGGAYYRGVTVPVQLTAGCQLRPRLAVQASVAYSSTSDSYFYPGKYYSGSAAAASPYAWFEVNVSNSSRTISTSLLARYTLTRQPAHRLQVDLLGGLTLVNRRSTSSGMRTDSDSTFTVNTTTHYADTDQQNDLLLGAGASARYRFGRHLEAVFDLTLHYGFGRPPVSSSWLTGATALGLRYRFGGRR